MTVGAPEPVCKDSVSSDRKGSFKCQAFFAEDEVRVVAEQPADGVGKARYNSAHRQCLLHMVASPPSTFDCETSGKFSSPRTEVTLQWAVLEELPILLEVCESTAAEDGGTSTDLELPCSVWGLVSLLLLLEGSVKLAHWFGGDCDPSLPAQTLLAADFLGCKGMRTNIIEYFQALLINSIEHSEKHVTAQAAAPDAVLSMAAHQAYLRNWHNTQVLRQLPTNFSAEVFCELRQQCIRSGRPPVKWAERAMHLPQDLLARWVASAAPVLDLRSAQLTALQWARLFTAIAQGGAGITELHVCGATDVHEEARSATESIFGAKLLKYSSQETNRRVCSMCKSRHKHGYTAAPPLQQGVGVITLCTDFASGCGHVDHIEHGPRMPAQDFYEQLCGGRVNIAECSQVLNTLAGVLPQLRSIKHVGLHSLPLQPQLMPALGQALLDLPSSLTALTLTISPAAQQGSIQRGMLFSSIALVRGLRELHMPDWEAIVGDDGLCVEPLYGLPHLEVVYVPVVKQNDAFPVGIPFQATSRGVAAHTTSARVMPVLP